MRTTVPVLAATALLGGLLGLAPGSAVAASCEEPTHPIDAGSDFLPDVHVGTTKTQTMALDVYTYDGCQVSGATATVHAPRTTTKVTLTEVGVANGRTHWSGTLAIKPSTLRNSDAGVWPVTYRVTGEHPDALRVRTHVQRASRLSFNAGPEPVTGDRLTFTGRLERASWNSDRYVGWADRKVSVTLDVPGEEDPDLVVEPRTRESGRYRVTRAYRGPGSYHADVIGTNTTAGAHSRLDEVG